VSVKGRKGSLRHRDMAPSSRYRKAGLYQITRQNYA
jgi:hypothetical protein